MKKTCVTILATVATLGIIQTTHADTIADWTFETSLPTGTGPGAVGPFNAEIGTGSAYAVGLNAISNPAGNGSSHSMSANGWTNSIPEYYQFDVNTVGYNNIGVTFDQTSSSTGPANFLFQYSTDGTSFTTFASYSVLVNGGSPNAAWNATTSSSAYGFSFDLSTITDLNNASTVDFRLLETGTASAGGATIGGAGTDRVDNMIVSASPVPEPSTMALCALGAVGGLLRLRRKR